MSLLLPRPLACFILVHMCEFPFGLSHRVCIVTSLYKALSSEEPVERRKASACLSRIGRAVTAVQANEKEREADSNVIKAAVKPLLRFQPDAGGGVVVHDLEEGVCCEHLESPPGRGRKLHSGLTFSTTEMAYTPKYGSCRRYRCVLDSNFVLVVVNTLPAVEEVGSDFGFCRLRPQGVADP